MRENPWFWSVSAIAAAWIRLVAVGILVVLVSGVVGGLIGQWVGLALVVPYLAICAVAWLRKGITMSSYWHTRRGWDWGSRLSTWHLRVIPRLLVRPR